MTIMSEAIGKIGGSVGNVADADGFDSIVKELSHLIGKSDSRVTIDMESGTSNPCANGISEIFKRIDTLT